MELSIIILNYNTKDLTLACIDSILKSNPKITYEIIVVDNGSSDGSPEVFDKIKGDKIRLLLHKKNLGFSKGNNSGIRKANGQYILLLNSDTLVTRGALEELLNFAKKTPSVGVVAPKLLNLDKSVQPSVFRFPTLTRSIYHYWLGKTNLLKKYYPQSQGPSEVEVVVAAAFLITPQARSKVGLLDERYFMYFEDIDYCRRIHIAGFKVYYLPSARVIHYHGASGTKIADKDNQWRRLIPSSKIYHGLFKHYLITLVLWVGNKWSKLLRRT